VVSPSGNDGTGYSVTERTAQSVGIGAFVSKEVPHAGRLFGRRGRCRHVADLPAVSIGAWGRPAASLSARTSAVQPPRERPIASAHGAARDRRNGCYVAPSVGLSGGNRAVAGSSAPIAAIRCASPGVVAGR